MIVSIVGCNQQNATTGNSEATTAESSEIVAMNPNDILFTTPTLNDALPATAESSAALSDCIQLHEDDWRQFEFISASLKPELDAELADIGVVWDEHSVPLGDSGTAFRQVHVRKRIPTPVHIPFTLADLERLVGRKTVPMTFFGYDERLRDVHAAQIDNLVVYALFQDCHITTIGLDAIDQFTLPTEFISRLSDFVREHKLMLVHWRSRTLFENHEDIMAYLGRRR